MHEECNCDRNAVKTAVEMAEEYVKVYKTLEDTGSSSGQMHRATQYIMDVARYQSVIRAGGLYSEQDQKEEQEENN